MTENSKLKFVIAGFGRIGRRHAEMIRGNPEAELVGICDSNVELKKEAGEFGVPFFASMDEMLEALPDAEVVNICTPNGLHASQSLDALKARKHVVCEKPMGLTKASCEEVIFKALQVSKHVFIVMQNRYSPPSAWLKEMIDNKRLGEIFFVEINCYWNRDNRYYSGDSWKGTKDLDGGTLFTQFSHFVDIMYWLFGDIENIEGRFADFNHGDIIDFEDSGFVSFDFVNGGKGVFNYSTSIWNKNLESTLTVVGSKGTVKIGGQYMNTVEHCNVQDYEMPELEEAGPPNDYGPYKGSAANHHFVIQNVIDTVKQRNVATTNALEGLKVVDIIERIYKVRDSKNWK